MTFFKLRRPWRTFPRTRWRERLQQGGEERKLPMLAATDFLNVAGLGMEASTADKNFHWEPAIDARPRHRVRPRLNRQMKRKFGSAAIRHSE